MISCETNSNQNKIEKFLFKTKKDLSHKAHSFKIGKPVISSIKVTVPFFECGVSAGFPSPAEEWADYTLDLNQHLIVNAPATFFVRAFGDSMQNVGIFDGDLLIVDRSIAAKNQHIVIASINSEFTVKRFIKTQNRTYLKAENEGFSDIELTEHSELEIWGVVTNVIHNLQI